MFWRPLLVFAEATGRWNSKFISWKESYISDHSLTTLTWNAVHPASENYELLANSWVIQLQETCIGEKRSHSGEEAHNEG